MTTNCHLSVFTIINAHTTTLSLPFLEALKEKSVLNIIGLLFFLLHKTKGLGTEIQRMAYSCTCCCRRRGHNLQQCIRDN